MKKALLIILALLSFQNANAEKKKQESEKEEVKPLRLASILIRDGHYKRAAAVLDGMNEKSIVAEKGRYHLLKGITAVKMGNHPAAVNDLKIAADLGQGEKKVYLLLAQSYFYMQKHKEVLESLDKAGEEATNLPSGFILKAQSHWKLGQTVPAWVVLNDGTEKYPRSRELLRLKTLLLLELGLYNRAAQVGRLYLRAGDVKEQDYIAIAQALKKAGQPRVAAELLEEALLLTPDRVRLWSLLARCYLEDEKFYTAATILHRVSYIDSRLKVEAAELYRKAGYHIRALLLNAQIKDPKTKVRQRLGILIEMERFEEAVALHPRLKRLGLLADEQIVYGLAFAYFRNEKYGSAGELLKNISHSSLYNKAIELRRIIARCIDRGWECVQ